MALSIHLIELDPLADQEGLCYDLNRARDEGLYEQIEYPDLLELAHNQDVSVNLTPGETVTVDVVVPMKYTYGYSARCDGDGHDDE
jgi:hypothetical protein